jgi:hypothetical protein
VVLAVVLVAIGALAAWIILSGGQRAQQAYFKDTATGEVFLASAENTPPITSPKGNEAVLIYMYGCGDCSGETFEGYYVKFEDGLEYSSPDAENWIDTRSDEHIQLLREVRARCEGQGDLIPCPPPM